MKKEQQTIYVSPKVKTVKIKTQQILCQSASNEDYINNNDPDWFN